MTTRSSASSYIQCRIFIDLTHDGGFALPVSLIILDNTKRINPKIAKFQFSCHIDYVLKETRESLEWNLLAE